SARLASIDAAPDGSLIDEPQVVPAMYNIVLPRKQSLRYGENPHQAAALYAGVDATGIAGGRQLHGKELSYNNLVDLDAAWQLVSDFKQKPTSVIIKHTNPCGSAQADT